MADLSAVMREALVSMLEEMVTNGKIWMQPLDFPNAEGKFNYYAASPSDPKGKLIVFRHGDGEAQELEMTKELRDELMAADKSQGVQANQDVKELRLIEDDAARAALQKLIGGGSADSAEGAAAATSFDDGQSRKLFKVADKDISSFFGGFESMDAKVAKIKKLLAKGADPNWHDEYESVLSRLCWKHQTPCVRVLLDAKADVNWKAEYNNTTALIEACRASSDDGAQAELVRLLLAAGAEVNVRNSNDEGPLHCLAESGGEAKGSALTASLLMEAGLRADDPGYAGGDKGTTPADMAGKKEAYTDSTKENRAELVACFKDPAAYKAKVDAWTAAAEAAAKEALSFKSDFEAFIADQDKATSLLSDVTSVNYCLGNNTDLTLTFCAKEFEYETSEIQLEDGMFPAANSHNTATPIPFNFAKSIWGNFFKRKINFASDCLLFAQNESTVYCKFSSKCLMDDSDYDGENKWAGAIVSMPIDTVKPADN